MITFKHKGDFKHTEGLFGAIKQRQYMKRMTSLGQRGVEALAAATPKLTGKTSESWVYEIKESDNCVRIIWSNTNNVNAYINVAVMLQYGHATRNGGWVEGIDYINPAMRPIFEKIADEAWEVIISK